MDTFNFDIAIGKQIDDIYPVMARYGPLGSESDQRAIDPKSQPLAGLLEWAETTVTASRGNEDVAEELGACLYRLLFAGVLGEFLRAALQHAESQGDRLRLRLSSEDLSILSLPWEFLYDETAGRLFATDHSAMLVRYLSDYRTFGRTRELRANLPLRMLMVVPAVPHLDVQGEIERVQAVLEDEQLSGRCVELTVLGGPAETVTLHRLLDRLQEDPAGFDILHFSGHGRVEGGRGYLRFNDENGAETWVGSGVLARSLRPYTGRLRLAILNACEGGRSAPKAYGVRSLLGVAPALIQNGLAAVIAMQYEILDEAALAFGRTFYRALTLGPTAGLADAAVTDARSRLAGQFPGHRSFATPVLFVHTEDGRIFDLPGGQEPQPRTVASPPAGAVRLSGLSADDEALLRSQATWTLQEVERQIQHRQRLLEISRRNLSHYQEQSQALGPAAPAYLTAQQEAEQANIEEQSRLLAQLNRLVDLAGRLAIPPTMTFGDFLEARLNEPVLKLFLAELSGDFDDLAVVQQIEHVAPVYCRRLAQRVLGDANASREHLAQALHPIIHGFVRRPGSGFILTPRGKYRRSARL